MKRLLYLFALSAMTVLMLAPAAFAQSRGPSGADGTFNCADFDDQGQAQEFFLRAGGPAADPNGLDDDNDGIACESLPTVTNPNAPAPGTKTEVETETKTEAKAGGTEAKAEQKKAKAKEEAKKEEKKEMPKTGGPGSASLLALGAGALLVGGGLLVGRMVR